MPPLSTLLQLLEPYSIVPGRQQKGLTRGPTPVLLSPTAYILGALRQNALGISGFSLFFIYGLRAPIIDLFCSCASFLKRHSESQEMPLLEALGTLICEFT